MEPILPGTKVSAECAPELLLQKRRFSQEFSGEIKVLRFLKAGVDTGCLRGRKGHLLLLHTEENTNRRTGRVLIQVLSTIQAPYRACLVPFTSTIPFPHV